MAREEWHHRLQASDEPDGRRSCGLEELRLPASPEAARIQGYAMATNAATGKLQYQAGANGAANQVNRAQLLGFNKSRECVRIG